MRTHFVSNELNLSERWLMVLWLADTSLCQWPLSCDTAFAREPTLPPGTQVRNHGGSAPQIFCAQKNFGTVCFKQ